VLQTAKTNQMILGTTNPTSVTHCKSVFTFGNTSSKAEINYVGELYATVFNNWHDYMSAQQEEDSE
jgi:hypothetical protein